MKQAPQLILADDLKDEWPLKKIEYPPTMTGSKLWTAARPLSYGGILTRFNLAWRVFSGECDALKWDGE